jgi:hypothetical protein
VAARHPEGVGVELEGLGDQQLLVAGGEVGLAAHTAGQHPEVVGRQPSLPRRRRHRGQQPQRLPRAHLACSARFGEPERYEAHAAAECAPSSAQRRRRSNSSITAAANECAASSKACASSTDDVNSSSANEATSSTATERIICRRSNPPAMRSA